MPKPSPYAPEAHRTACRKETTLTLSFVGDVAASPLSGNPMQALLALLWSEHMDGFPVELPVFLLATFASALVAGLSGFAFGLVAASIWLYMLTPLQTATLIIGFGLLVQGLFGFGNSAAHWIGKGFGRLCWAQRSACPSACRY